MDKKKINLIIEVVLFIIVLCIITFVSAKKSKFSSQTLSDIIIL